MMFTKMKILRVWRETLEPYHQWVQDTWEHQRFSWFIHIKFYIYIWLTHFLQLQFKRPAGPRNRRSPSRRSRSNSLEDKEEIELDTQSRNDNASHELETSTLTDTKPSREREPVPKPRVAFLELTNHTENKSSPDASPSNARKPFIPPLDLSTLHEHIDSSGEGNDSNILLCRGLLLTSL